MKDEVMSDEENDKKREMISDERNNE